jgi:hypothetical protein
MSPKAKASTTKKRGTTRNKSTPAKTPIKVFISYSHKDTNLKDEFMDMLEGLERQKVIKVWHDREIEPGDNWYRAIRSAMRNCDIAIILISQSFLNSEFIAKEEVPNLLARRKRQGMRVVPIILRPCLWKDDPVLSKIQALPRDGKPIIKIPRANGKREQAWLDIAQSIRRRANLLQRNQ